jgi:predicted nucleic acid-binding Zn ribbon protein
MAREALAAARAEARKRQAGRGPSEGGTGARRTRRSAADTRRSGSGPDDRDPQQLGRSIDRLVSDRGWETAAAVGGVMGRWDAIVGQEIAAHCRPETFDGGELTVRTDTTAWATQVRLLAAQLVHRLNVELGDGTVTRVKVLGPGAPSWQHGRLSVKGRGPRDTYG